MEEEVARGGGEPRSTTSPSSLSRFLPSQRDKQKQYVRVYAASLCARSSEGEGIYFNSLSLPLCFETGETPKESRSSLSLSLLPSFTSRSLAPLPPHRLPSSSNLFISSSSLPSRLFPFSRLLKSSFTLSCSRRARPHQTDDEAC